MNGKAHWHFSSLERERGRERKRAQIFIQNLKAKRIADVSFAQSKWRIRGMFSSSKNGLEGNQCCAGCLALE